MDKHALLQEFVKRHPASIGRVVDYTPATDSLFQFDFTASNTGLAFETIADTDKFTAWVNKKLAETGCRYGVGGYMEHRTLYARSGLFNEGAEPRRLHLGMDIWAAAGTAVYAPLNGQIHSFNDNNNFGDYGPAIILEHNVNGLRLYSLYGHLKRDDLRGLKAGRQIVKGQKIGSFGNADENGHWPPHLHFQLIFDMEGNWGDYPGVCRYSEKDKFRLNIPDPNLILQFPGIK